MTRQELYYLQVILRRLYELKEFVGAVERTKLSMLAMECLLDEIDWLADFIDRHTSKPAPSPKQ
jgi:hypothetical protein